MRGEHEQVEVEQFSEAEELSGKLGFGSELMKSVIENDASQIEDGKLIENAFNQGMSGFMPDMMFEKLVNNYSLAKKLFGERLIQRLSGYDPKFVEKNIKVPEFQKELREKVEDKLKTLREKGFLDKNNQITGKGIEMAALVLYIKELDNLTPAGRLGEKLHREPDKHGTRTDIRSFAKGDRYRDLSIQKSVRTAIRRKHDTVLVPDLKVNLRESKGEIEVVYALDASASMKGDKIEAAKKAGVALAFRALEQHDKVGVIVFGEEVKSSLNPTYEFDSILRMVAQIQSAGQTDFVLTIKEAIALFSSQNITKHLVLLTDALPTTGEDPEKETLEAVSLAAAFGITVTVIGLNLDAKGKKFAQKIAEVGKGRLYITKNVEDLDKIIIEDYYSIS
ncbi:VWA domain-containing protein [Candidatus Woesearchaeota archaeon]|nr:VWA domain-containing protein [Candidatus Woesearchaeota archaeon]